MAAKRGKKPNKKLSIKQLDAKAHELIASLNRHGVFVPNAPTMKEVAAEDGNFHNSKQRKGRGTGNTKQNKRQMKKNHRLLLELWVKQLQEAVNEVDPQSDEHDCEHSFEEVDVEKLTEICMEDDHTGIYPKESIL